jgi:hypothetical protein
MLRSGDADDPAMRTLALVAPGLAAVTGCADGDCGAGAIPLDDGDARIVLDVSVDVALLAVGSDGQII